MAARTEERAQHANIQPPAFKREKVAVIYSLSLALAGLNPFSLAMLC